LVIFDKYNLCLDIVYYTSGYPDCLFAFCTRAILENQKTEKYQRYLQSVCRYLTVQGCW